uniref:Uncharacterized protein n=1 Tax=Sphaerodactylus townsendi TaxID=933632 RepID=A0ACB8FKM0_9SAUR
MSVHKILWAPASTGYVAFSSYLPQVHPAHSKGEEGTTVTHRPVAENGRYPFQRANLASVVLSATDSVCSSCNQIFHPHRCKIPHCNPPISSESRRIQEVRRIPAHASMGRDYTHRFRLQHSVKTWNILHTTLEALTAYKGGQKSSLCGAVPFAQRSRKSSSILGLPPVLRGVSKH